jgi:hypothetical protein
MVHVTQRNAVRLQITAADLPHASINGSTKPISLLSKQQMLITVHKTKALMHMQSTALGYFCIFIYFLY